MNKSLRVWKRKTCVARPCRGTFQPTLHLRTWPSVISTLCATSAFRRSRCLADSSALKTSEKSMIPPACERGQHQTYARLERLQA